jgi:hypothetical protein
MMTRSAALLRTILDGGNFLPELIARELEISQGDLEQYARCEQVMPLSRQMSLARFVIRYAPPLARRGHALRAQVSAALEFHARKPAPNSGAFASWPSLRRPRK